MRIGIVKCMFMVLALVPGFNEASAESSGKQPQLPSMQSGIWRTVAQSSGVALLDKLHDRIEKLYDEGKYEEAIPLAKQVLEGRETILGAEHGDVTKSIYVLAELYQAVNDYQAAEQMYRRLLAIWDKTQHPMNSEFSLALGRYGCLLRKNKRRDEAEKLEIRAYGISVGEASDKIQSTAIPPFKKVKNGKMLSMPNPSYPKKAKQAGIVYVRVVIDEEAKVILACAVSGNALLAAAVEQAAYRARFTPTVVNDKPVKITGVLTYNFR
jgi:tetratricopeptide (TPR) repeat protein